MSKTGKRQKARDTGTRYRKGCAARAKTTSIGFSTTWTGRTELAAACLLSLFIVALHLAFRASAGPLWRDEVNSINMATLATVPDIWDHLKWDSFPILFSLVLRGWANLGGGSDAGLRLFGLLVGLLLLGSLWLSSRLLSSRLPILSLSIFGLNSVALVYGDSIRPYGLGLLFIVLTFAFVWRVAEVPRTGRVVLAALAAMLSVQCMYQNALLVLAIIMGGVAVTVRHRLWRRSALLIGVGIMAAVSLVPYWPAVSQGRDWMAITKGSIGLDFVGQRLMSSLEASSDFMPWVWLATLMVSLVVTPYFQLHGSPAEATDFRSDVTLYCLVALLIGGISFLALTLALGVPPALWHFLPVMALAAVAMDGILGTIAPAIAWRAALALGIWLVSGPTVWSNVHQRLTNMDSVAGLLKAKAQANDLVLVNPWYCAVGLSRHYQAGTSLETLPPMGDSRIHRYDLLKKQMLMPNAIAPVLTRMQETLQGGGRVWIVGGLQYESGSEPPSPLPPAPRLPSGWWYGPYMSNWEKQAAYFLQTHALQIDLALEPTKYPAVNPLENCPVFVVQGWK